MGEAYYSAKVGLKKWMIFEQVWNRKRDTIEWKGTKENQEYSNGDYYIEKYFLLKKIRRKWQNCESTKII